MLIILIVSVYETKKSNKLTNLQLLATARGQCSSVPEGVDGKDRRPVITPVDGAPGGCLVHRASSNCLTFSSICPWNNGGQLSKGGIHKIFLSCWPHFPSFLARGFLPPGNESLCLYVLKTVSRGGITFPTPGVESLFRPQGLETLFRPWCGITFPTPGVGNTFPSLGRKQYQSDSTPGMEKLLHFSILSPQISILPWLGLHKAWNL